MDTEDNAIRLDLRELLFVHLIIMIEGKEDDWTKYMNINRLIEWTETDQGKHEVKKKMTEGMKKRGMIIECAQDRLLWRIAQ